MVAGFVLGEGGLEILEFDPEGEFVSDMAIIALVVILFRDGLEVDEEMLQQEWRLPLRKLVLAMPITAGLVAVATHALIGLAWTEAFLVGALLSPTDPVLSSSVVTNPRVPKVVRNSLNLESGLNDGLALPAVLALSAALDAAEDGFVWWEFVLQDVSLGLLFGLAIGFAASKLMPRRRALARDIPAHQKSIYALGTAFVAYGVAVADPAGNGLISVYVCAIVLGIMRPDIREYFEHQAEDIVEVVKLGVFVVFGALLTLDGLFTDGWAAIALVAVTLFVARPVAVFLALARTSTDMATRGFMAWFGPKGVATMTFSLLVLGATIPEGERIFNLAALCVFASILLHGLSDTPGSEWLARHAERRDAVRPGGPPAPARSGTPTPPGSGAPGGR